MRRLSVLPFLLALTCSTACAEPLPTDETGAIDYLSAKGIDIKRDAEGHAVRLMSSGKPALTVEEYQLIGLLTHLEQMGLNAAPLDDEQWGFLKSLPKLKTLSIWHGHHFATLKPFRGLPVESLTIGGCMGLRGLNKDDPDKPRHAITTLGDLPNLKKANLYQSGDGQALFVRTVTACFFVTCRSYRPEGFTSRGGWVVGLTRGGYHPGCYVLPQTVTSLARGHVGGGRDELPNDGEFRGNGGSQGDSMDNHGLVETPRHRFLSASGGCSYHDHSSCLSERP